MESRVLSQDRAASTSQGPLVESVAVRVLAAALSALDGGTHAHAQRIARIAEATTRSMGRSEEEQYLIRLAALLHDVGKIGIPVAILHKPGPLSAEEWAIMRRHPEIGRRILEEAGGIFQPLAAIVVAHHERWDGHGYPAGLEGNEIPLAARILSVVDAYDAMTFRRPYREPLTTLQAKAELQRCAGSQFDPNVVEAFLTVLDERCAKPAHDMLCTCR